MDPVYAFSESLRIEDTEALLRFMLKVMDESCCRGVPVDIDAVNMCQLKMKKLGVELDGQ